MIAYDLVAILEKDGVNWEVLNQYQQELFELSKTKDRRTKKTLRKLFANGEQLYHQTELNFSATLNLGKIYRRLNLYGDAIACFSSLLNHNPDNSRCHYFLGLCYQSCGMNHDAIIHYKKALKLRPNYERAENRLSQSLQLNENESSEAVGSLIDREQFENYSHRNTIPGMTDIIQCKFIITHINSANPMFYFCNTREHKNHYLFYKNILGYPISSKQFDYISYSKNSTRENLCGFIVAHDNVTDKMGNKGLFSLGYWATDGVAHQYIKLSWDMVIESAPFLKEKLYYHLSSQLQTELYNREKSHYQDSKIRVIDTDTLFNHMHSIPLNLGESHGILRIMEMDDIPTKEDIVIFKTLPNDLSNVRGIISDVPQTPLSHVNLKAKQNKIPNIYIKDASQDPKFIALQDKPVYFKVTPDGYDVRPVSSTEYSNAKSKNRRKKSVTLQKALHHKTIIALNDTSMNDSSAIGSKAANIGELSNLLHQQHVIDGHAIPFYFYHNFMLHNGLYKSLEAILADKHFHNNHEFKEHTLREFRELLIQKPVPYWMHEHFHKMNSSFQLQDLRLRSSSNNEDLPDFNGAGLYDSKIHYGEHDEIDRNIKSIWSSLWTYRAFEERDYHHIEHDNVAMGILVHEDHKNELYNGVCVTKNLFHKVYKGFYINVQSGTSLVTNPDVQALPEEILIAASGPKVEYEIQYLRHSNLIPKTQKVMNKDDVMELIGIAETIHTHFKQAYLAENNNDFAMEIEFLKTPQGELKIMQARPWLD